MLPFLVSFSPSICFVVVHGSHLVWSKQITFYEIIHKPPKGRVRRVQRTKIANRITIYSTIYVYAKSIASFELDRWEKYFFCVFLFFFFFLLLTFLPLRYEKLRTSAKPKKNGPTFQQYKNSKNYFYYFNFISFNIISLELQPTNEPIKLYTLSFILIIISFFLVSSYIGSIR